MSLQRTTYLKAGYKILFSQFLKTEDLVGSFSPYIYDMCGIIFKDCLGLGLPLSRSILSITRKRLAFDSVRELSYFISFAEKTKNTYNVIKLKKVVGRDSATAEANYSGLHY